MLDKDKQKIYLGWGNMVSILMALALLIIAFLLWKENSFTVNPSSSNTPLPSNFPQLKLRPNQNFN